MKSSIEMAIERFKANGGEFKPEGYYRVYYTEFTMGYETESFETLNVKGSDKEDDETIEEFLMRQWDCFKEYDEDENIGHVQCIEEADIEAEKKHVEELLGKIEPAIEKLKSEVGELREDCEYSIDYEVTFFETVMKTENCGRPIDATLHYDSVEHWLRGWWRGIVWGLLIPIGYKTGSVSISAR